MPFSSVLILPGRVTNDRAIGSGIVGASLGNPILCDTQWPVPRNSLPSHRIVIAHWARFRLVHSYGVGSNMLVIKFLGGIHGPRARIDHSVRIVGLWVSLETIRRVAWSQVRSEGRGSGYLRRRGSNANAGVVSIVEFVWPVQGTLVYVVNRQMVRRKILSVFDTLDLQVFLSSIAIFHLR